MDGGVHFMMAEDPSLEGIMVAGKGPTVACHVTDRLVVTFPNHSLGKDRSRGGESLSRGRRK